MDRKLYMCVFMIIICFLNTSCKKTPDIFIEANKEINIYPDYRDITIPPNIAVLNFSVIDSADCYFFSIASTNGVVINKKNKSGLLKLKNKTWQKLLNNSEKLIYNIYLKNNNKWVKFPPFENTIALDSIDSYITYRYFLPSFQVINNVGIYRRNISNFDVQSIIKTNYENLCFNCHVYAANDSHYSMFHEREKNMGGTVISSNGKIFKIVPKTGSMSNSATYAAWHPSGKYIAFSANKVDQIIYTSAQRRDAYDISSDLVIYNIENNIMFSDSVIYGEKYLETYPCWDPKGEYLYFCRTAYKYADSVKTIFDVAKYKNVKYDLMRIRFSEQERCFGKPEYVLKADSINKSIVLPRISPNGRYILFCALDYGNFPIFHKESDLWVLDLKNKQCNKVKGVNSNFAEGYHSWSKNGQWITYSSKAIDGAHTTLWLTYFNNPERVGKPFVLPQKDPLFYKTFIKSFSVPEFTVNNFSNQKELYKITNIKDDAITPIAGRALNTADGVTGATREYKH